MKTLDQLILHNIDVPYFRRLDRDAIEHLGLELDSKVLGTAKWSATVNDFAEDFDAVILSAEVMKYPSIHVQEDNPCVRMYGSDRPEGSVPTCIWGVVHGRLHVVNDENGFSGDLPPFYKTRVSHKTVRIFK